MRSAHFNFALAIAVSIAAHLLLWPAGMRLVLPGMGDIDQPTERHGEVTLLLNDDPEPAPPKVEPPKQKKPPVVESPDDMGESTGKGTGSQAAKGKDLLRAPEAEQDQAFLSRDPVGMGRVGDPPTFETGPRGQNGSGGQVGGAAIAPNPAHSPSPDENHPTDQPAKETKVATAQEEKLPPRESPVHFPDPEVPSVNPPKDVAPPPSQTASVGSAAADLNRPPMDEVKAHGPLAQVASISDGDLHLAPLEGPTTAPSPASSTAPPSKPDAPKERMAVALAPQLEIPKAAVATPPPPAVEVNLPKPKTPDVTQPKAASVPAPVAPAIVTTGDARAPGQDRASADPAQESDSESDAFAKKLVSAVMHDGRLDVRQGRKVKTTRPHFGEGIVGAFLSNPNPILVFKVSIDATGKVVDVQPIRQTGSIEIDQPCRVAMYDWWFEPTHDKAGKPVADVIPFEIRFR